MKKPNKKEALPVWFPSEIKVVGWRGFDIQISRFEIDSEWGYWVQGRGDLAGLEAWSSDEGDDGSGISFKTPQKAQKASMEKAMELLGSRKTCKCCDGLGHVFKDTKEGSSI